MKKRCSVISNKKETAKLDGINPEYFGHLRNDVLGFVPPDVRQVLSVGCGKGITEAQLVSRGVTVVGIEKNPKAAKIAKDNGLVMISSQDANELPAELAAWVFDCVIYSDVLEHIRNPEKVIESHLAFLDTGGMVIISVPNFRYWSIFKDLFFRGELVYQDAGILDRDHVRITTRKMVERWLSNNKLSIKNSVCVINRRRDRWLSSFLGHCFCEFFATQVIITAKKS